MRSVRLIISILFLLALPAGVLAWPLQGQWHAVQQGGGPIHDPQDDAGGARNVVPDNGSVAAAYIYNDGVNIYFRFRLDADPSGQGGQGLLQSFGWGFEIDTDQNADDYEWLMMLDGISAPEVIRLMENTVKSHLGDPSDKAEDVIAPYPLAGNYRILAAETCYDSHNNPGGVCNAQYDYRDYYLDYKIPYAVFKSATGITDQSIIRFFVGSSSSANNLTENGADLVAGSDLYSMGSDYVTPFGDLPTGTTFYDGTVRFVNDLNGAFDRTLEAPGNPLYIRVDDLDLNAQSNPSGILVVTVTSPTGDSERVTLYATGVQGKYTGQLPTANTYSNDNSGTLYVQSGQTVTVTYQEALTAARVSNVSRTDTIYFSATATDIAITKTVDIVAPAEGQLVTFTVTATNNGPGAVTSLTVADALPAGLTYDNDCSHASHGTYAGGVWSANFTPPLAVGDSATLTLCATVNAGTNGQTRTNTATRTASTPNDGYAGNDSASASVKVGGTDLRVTKTVNNPLPAPGGTVVFTVRVLNLGPAATGGVQISDSLPSGLTYVSSNPSQGSYSGGVWNVGTLANGAGALLRITATVDAGTTGDEIVNTATLTDSDQPDTNAANNSASATLQVGYVDLILRKKVRRYAPTTTSFGDSVAANTGNTVEFRVEVENNGPHDASGIVVADTLPTGLTLVNGSVSDPTNFSYNGTTRIGTWNLGALADGATATLTFRATVNAGTAGQTLTNQAAITAVDQPDSNPGDEYDDALVAVNGTDLRITKCVWDTATNQCSSNLTPNPGNTVVWRVSVYNDGPNSASSITVSDYLPPALTRTSHSTSQGTWSATGGSPTWIWSVGTLNVNASATLTITTTVNAGTTGQTITNDAFITGSSQADPNDANNVASAYVYIGGTDLKIEKTVDDSTPNVGQDIVYTLTVSNTGPSAATGVVVNDLLPPEVDYFSHTSPSGHNSYNDATGVWTIGNLANGGTATLQITATVLNEDSHLVITNTATVSATQADPDPTDNTATVDIHVNAADLAVSKTEENGNATPAEGQTIVYVVTIANTGANTATGIELEDDLPAGVTLVSANPSQGSYAAGIWLVGDIAADDDATLRLTVTVDSGTAGTTITNTATIVALDQLDADDTNDSDSYAIVPRQIPVLTIMKSANGKVSAAPGEVITYTVTVHNTGSAIATAVALTDNLSPYTEWGLDFNNDGAPYDPFDFNPGTSGLSRGTAQFFDSNGPYTPTAGGGYDGNVTAWRLPMTGNMAVGGNFTLKYKVRVK